jgi:mycothiol synthase
VASFAFAVNVRPYELGAHRVEMVRAALDATAGADGVQPLSEEARLRLGADGPGVTHIVVGDDDGIAGYAQLDVLAELERPTAEAAAAELFVEPRWRGRGIGTALLQTAREIAPDLFVWSHGDLPAARALATRAGLHRVRDLWQMRRPLDELPPVPATPDGITLRTFEPGRDEASWLELNAAAFATHPEQGSWTAHDLALRKQEPWFDPAGFFLAERDDRLVGFHWTKVETEPEPTGEVYVLGVAPDEAGHGLGSWLTAVGLHHLAAKGLPTVLLYVEATNAAAVTVYERQGFTRHAVDVGYRTP